MASLLKNEMAERTSPHASVRENASGEIIVDEDPVCGIFNRKPMIMMILSGREYRGGRAA
jgi:hypothetical protein